MDSSDNALAPIVRFEGVHVLYGNTLALDIERLEIRPGERIFFLGRSGSGKTTLSKLIKGRLRPSTGRISVLGSNPAVETRRQRRTIQRRIAMIDQEFYLVPRISVADNVLSGCLGRVDSWKSMFGWFPNGELQKAESIIREVELDGLENRRVETLSGGQRQRAAIARALMQDAEIILADEPVSNLDPELAIDALELLVACVTRRKETLLVNLHQPSLARMFATRIIGLSAGKIVYDGTPEDFTEDAAQFLYTGESEDAGEIVPIGAPAQSEAT